MDVLLITSSRGLEATLREELESHDLQMVCVHSSAKLVEVVAKHCADSPKVIVIDGIDARGFGEGELDGLRRCCPGARIIALSRYSAERDPGVIERKGVQYLAAPSVDQVAGLIQSLSLSGAVGAPRDAAYTPRLLASKKTGAQSGAGRTS